MGSCSPQICEPPKAVLKGSPGQGTPAPTLSGDAQMPPMALQVPAGGPFETSCNSTLWPSGSPQMGPAEAARFQAAQRAHPARKWGGRLLL